MAISFQKLIDKMKQENKSLYVLKSEKVIGTATLNKIRTGTGHVDTRSINSLCAYFNCQPGDLMEYVPDK